MDLFTQERFELMIDMATKKLQQEMASLKEYVSSLNSEIGSLKSQVSRMQFQPQASQQAAQRVSESLPENQGSAQQQTNDAHIVDCRPDNERREQFKSGAARNAEPARPRYGDYEPKDVSIEKFFYFGRK